MSFWQFIPDIVQDFTKGYADWQQADINRDWQERMSNTSYQRMMNDMRAAGLNPMLAYQQGGAGTPGGAQAPPTRMNSALSMKRQIAEIKNIKEDTIQKNIQHGQIHAHTEKLWQEAEAARHHVSTAKSQAAIAKLGENWARSPTGKNMDRLNRIIRSLNPFISSAKGIVPKGN